MKRSGGAVAVNDFREYENGAADTVDRSDDDPLPIGFGFDGNTKVSSTPAAVRDVALDGPQCSAVHRGAVVCGCL